MKSVVRLLCLATLVFWCSAGEAFLIAPRARDAGVRTTVGTSTNVADVASSSEYTGAAADAVSQPRTGSGGHQRTTAPVILVGSQRGRLCDFAEHLSRSSCTAGRIHDLGELAEIQGPRAVERALAGSATDGILVCLVPGCLRHPEVERLVRAHPITVQLAIPGEDDAVRTRCEKVTKYTVIANQEDSNHAKADLLRLIAFARQGARSSQDVRLDMGKNSFFLSLTLPDMVPHAALLPELAAGVDAMELRADLLADHDPYSVLQQLSVLRRHTGHLPVVFTVRSKCQCGAFPDDPDAIFRLARWGLRAGAEMLDIEANWPVDIRKDFIEEARRDYPGVVLIGSYHVVGRRTSEDSARRLFQECAHDGKVDAVKVVTSAFEPEDNFLVHMAAKSACGSRPYIALCLTEAGKLSRVLNERFTPVTHEKLPSVAAPGQLSAKDIMRHRVELGLCPSQSFFLFGHPISASPSPDMHNAGFKRCGLPHKYSLWEGEDPRVMEEALSRRDFGGASVTIPHKQNVLPLLDRVSQAAADIGAVNTVVVERDAITGRRLLVGENTDWLGIYRPVKRRLGALDWEACQSGVALVVGAGGASMAALYAMQAMGLQVVVFNRTPDKARSLADRFSCAFVSSLEAETLSRECDCSKVKVVISTIPAVAEFKLPSHILESKPVIFDAAYKPALTTLLAQAREAECPYVQGAEMLLEQGLEQFQLWTERRAPRSVMEDAVFAKVERI